MKWNVIDSGALSAEENMEYDRQLLETAKEPTLRFYEWASPSATVGYFIKKERFFRPDAPVDIAKRPTGGGIIFHGNDLTFTVFLPVGHPWNTDNPLKNYSYINGAILKALQASHLPIQILSSSLVNPENSQKDFCMANPTHYDLLLNGKKIGGAAQRQKKNRGLIQQTSLSIGPPNLDLIEKSLIHPKLTIEAIRTQSSYLNTPIPIKNFIQSITK